MATKDYLIGMKPEYNIQIQQEQQQVQKVDLKTAEDMHRYAMFVKGNTETGPDGRRYTHIDEDGEYQSCFVSQYSPIIDDNLEPKIKKVCQLLHNKGYLTFGSCQGHADSLDRWVGLVFNNKEQKQKFIDEVNKFGLEVYWYDNFLNTKEEPRDPDPWYSDEGGFLHIVWDAPELTDLSVDYKRNKPYTKQELTKFWNIQMCRQYDSYEAIVMWIGFKRVGDTLLDHLYHRIRFNWKHVDKVTKQLEDKLLTLSSYDG